MKKSVVLLALAAAVYLAYQKFAVTSGVYNEDGSAAALLVVFDRCGEPCEDAVRLLDSKGIVPTSISMSASAKLR